MNGGDLSGIEDLIVSHVILPIRGRFSSVIGHTIIEACDYWDLIPFPGRDFFLCLGNWHKIFESVLWDVWVM